MSFVALGMRSEWNTRKIENKQLDSFSRQCSSTPIRNGHGFLSKELCDNTAASHMLFWTGCTSSSPVPSTEINIEGAALLWRCWHNQEWDWNVENTIKKWLLGMFQTLLQSLIEVYNCAGVLFWRKCCLNDWVVLYFLEINWFREHFEATTYVIMLTVLVFKRVPIVVQSVH